MRNKRYCWIWLLITNGLMLSCWTDVTTAFEPNVVLIMADDLGYGDVSCYNGWIKTPHIDSIAKGGIRFTDFHSNGTICSPTRAALMTGRYQQRAGIPSVIAADLQHPTHHRGLQLNETTIAEAFRRQGYACAIFGKWHLGYFPNYNPTLQGFDKFVGYVSGNIDFHSHVDQSGVFDWWHDMQPTIEKGYSTHLITAHAVKFIKENHTRPFFLYVPHEAPHYPYQGPMDSPDRTVGGEFNNKGSRTDTKEAYREMVIEMDKGIGKILDALREASIVENTIVVFCSDNGATTLGSNGALRGFKGTNFEGGHRVPCVIQWPGHIDANIESTQLMATMDFLPSLFGMAGFKLPKQLKLDGIDLSDVILTKQEPIVRSMVWNGTTIRRGHWKYMAPQKGLAAESLFDLSAEVGESTNLIAESPRMAHAFRLELEMWRRDMERTKTAQPAPPK